MRARSSLTLALMLTLVPLGHARAQETAPAGEAPADSGAVEEIVVTISKREEALTEIPASVNAFTGDLLQQADFESASDLATLIPGFVTKGEGRTGAISIRGISEGFTGQASVARHVNGVFQRDGSLGFTGMYYDLKAIEVTRGPAGTVYGRNATAGAVNLIWNEPKPERELQVDVTLGNHDRRQLRGVLNLPLLGAGDERLMFRFSLQRELRDGYLDDDFQSDADDPQNLDDWTARAALRSRPTEDLTLDLRGYYTHSDANTNIFRPLRSTYPAGTLVLGANGEFPFDWANGLAQFKAELLNPARATIWRFIARNEVRFGLFPDLDSAVEDILLLGRDVSGNGVIDAAEGDVPPLVRSPEFFSPALPIHRNPLRTRSRLIQNVGRRPELEVWGVDGTLDWHLGDLPAIGALDLRMVGGYQFVELHQLSDADGTELGVIDSSQHHTRHSGTVDAQLVTDGEELPLDAILGFFYFRNTDDRPDQHALTPLGDFPSDEYREIEGVAVYLSANARPLELFSDDPPVDVELFGGVRWNRDSEYLDLTNYPNVLRPFAQLDGKVTFRKWTWEAGVRWFAAEDQMLYFKWATNYKPGLQQLDLTNSLPAPVEPEQINAWELGWKAGWFDRRLTTALTGYRYAYDDLQVPQLINNQLFTANAGEAEIWGVELELSAMPTDAWLVQANAGYLHARFLEFCADDPAVDSPVDAPGCPPTSQPNNFNGAMNLAGNVLEDAPEWKVSLFTSYAIDLGRRGTLTPVLKVTWTDSYSLRPFNLAIDRVPSYSRTDVRLRWDSPEEHYSVEAYVENLEDEVVFARTTVGPDFTGGFPASVGVLPPRMFGVRVGFHWGGD